jgi:hypothetical protein
MAGVDIFRGLKDLPFRRFALAQLNRVNDLVQRLGVPAMADQYPGKQEPSMFSCIYGPITLQATRRLDTAGFDLLAPLVTPQTPVLPRDANPVTGHDYAFYWMDWNVAGFVQWGWTEDPGDALLPVPIDPTPLGDIFDPVLGANGGAQIWQNFSNSLAFLSQPRICFEIDLYDKKKGRSITNGRLPSEIVCGGAFEFKKAFGPTRWDPDTEIEPRVYITEVKMSPRLDTDSAFEAAQVQVFLNIAFRGYHAFDGHPSGANY